MGDRRNSYALWRKALDTWITAMITYEMFVKFVAPGFALGTAVLLMAYDRLERYLSERSLLTSTKRTEDKPELSATAVAIATAAVTEKIFEQIAERNAKIAMNAMVAARKKRRMQLRAQKRKHSFGNHGKVPIEDRKIEGSYKIEGLYENAPVSAFFTHGLGTPRY